MSGDPRALSEVRDRLRALGYLRGPIEGWLAAGGGRLRSSLKAAILAGPLLGVPSAIAVALANRPHFNRPADLAILALYASAILGAALGLLELAAASVLGGLASRGVVLVGRFERAAGRVGLLLGGAASLYLALLLRGGRLTGGEIWPVGIPSALAWGLAALVALTIGRAVGRLVRVGALVSLAARPKGEPAGSLPPAGPSASADRRARRVALSLLLLAGLVAIILLPGGRPRPAVPPEPPRGRLFGRILVLGVDGLSAERYARLKDQARLPALAAIEASGARLPLAAESERVPPVVWTTIATGRPPSQHGILGYEAGRLAGIPSSIQPDGSGAAPILSPALLLPFAAATRAPVSAGLRRALTIWEIFEAGGIPSAIVNGWATWPVAADGAVQVSDRAFARLLQGRRDARDVWPQALGEDLALRFGEDLAAARAGLPAGLLASGSPRAIQAALIDAWHALVAGRLLASPELGLGIVYLPGLDIAGGEEPALSDLAGTVDRLAGELWRMAGEGKGNDLVIVVAEAGRPGEANRSGEGFLLMSGRGIVPGRRFEAARGIDLVPTLLALGGFPPARDLSGKRLVEFFPANDPSHGVISAIMSYGGRAADGEEGARDPADREMLERLRSLGYIN